MTHDGCRASGRAGSIGIGKKPQSVQNESTQSRQTHVNERGTAQTVMVAGAWRGSIAASDVAPGAQMPAAKTQSFSNRQSRAMVRAARPQLARLAQRHTFSSGEVLRVTDAKVKPGVKSMDLAEYSGGASAEESSVSVNNQDGGTLK